MKRKISADARTIILIFMCFLTVALISGVATYIFILHDVVRLEYLVRYGAQALFSIIDYFTYEAHSKKV